MAKKIDLQPIEEDHISELCSFLNSMGVSSKIDRDADFVQEDATPESFFRVAKGMNQRIRYIKLEGMNIDGIRYHILQVIADSESGAELKDYWQAFYEYCAVRDIGMDKKDLQNLEAHIKAKKKGLFKKEIVDFRWVGGRIADVLNQDTSLKEPIFAHLITIQTIGIDVDISILPESLPTDKEIREYIKALRKEGIYIDSPEDAVKKMRPMGQGVWIRVAPTVGFRRIWPTGGYKDVILPLLLPSKDAFKAYDRIAKHIRDYAATI